MTNNGMTNGFSIKSWSDLGSVLLLITFIVSGLAWGLKLEDRLDNIMEDVVTIRLELSPGVLPRAEERIAGLLRRIEKLEDQAEIEHQ
jgi:hypothetical protein